jgi:alkylhydroperoxidase family enzyme
MLRSVSFLFASLLWCGAASGVDQGARLAPDARPPSSVPLDGANLGLGNANWMAGLVAQSQWTWSAQLLPQAFDNNLGRFFLHIPAVFETQLGYSTALIFDEPSFRNGGQMSGFVDRVTRELVISHIAQRRRSRYSMTHHALLGALTARQHGLDDAAIAAKWSHLLDYRDQAKTYTAVERAALRFAEAFATDPKTYTDDDYRDLRTALTDDNRRRFGAERRWQAQLAAARAEHARVTGTGGGPGAAREAAARAARRAARAIDARENERLVDQQVVELAFVCLQFVALTDVLTALNVPDEAGFADVMTQHVPAAVVTQINALIAAGGRDIGSLVPPPVDVPTAAIRAGQLRVDPAPLRGTRVPLVSWEEDPTLGTRDKGLAVGGAHIGVYGWSAGTYFPGGLGFLVVHHPELARTEPAYSLPLLFNEDEWRNGVHTSGFTDRLLKELLIQRVYRLTRNRYGIEHHSMFLLNEYDRVHGAGAARHPRFDDAQAETARQRARAVFRDAVLALSGADGPDPFTPVQRAVLDWTGAIVTRPHEASHLEGAVRAALERQNREEVAAGLRRLDHTAAADEAEAHRRLLDRQVAELAMAVGHMDGLGRVLSILRIEGERPVQIAQGTLTPDGGLVPTLDDRGRLQLTGYFNTRPGILETLDFLGLPPEVLTANELLLNPDLNGRVRARLAAGETAIHVPASEAQETGEF